MRVKIKREWRCHRVGSVVELGDGIAVELISRGYAEKEMPVVATREVKVAHVGSRKGKG